MAKKLRGKEWYEIIAPKIFDEKVIGQTPVGDPQTLKNRVTSVSVINLLNDTSKYYLKFSFKIKEIKEKKAFTEFHGFECLRDYISRMVRHGVIRMDDVFDISTKDTTKIRVKTITLISKKASRKIEVNLRKFIKEKLEKEISSINLDEFIKRVLDDSLKRDLVDEGSKIYPIYNFEMRKVERLS